jgi:hypothetical protein
MSHTTNTELLPCPFCKWQFVRMRESAYDGCFAECCDDKCHARGPWRKDEQEAASAWNASAQASAPEGGDASELETSLRSRRSNRS